MFIIHCSSDNDIDSYANFDSDSITDCAHVCASDPRCLAATYTNRCYPKDSRENILTGRGTNVFLEMVSWSQTRAADGASSALGEQRVALEITAAEETLAPDSREITKSTDPDSPENTVLEAVENNEMTALSETTFPTKTPQSTEPEPPAEPTADTNTGASENTGAPRDGDSENKAKLSDPMAAAQNPEPEQAAGSEQESDTALKTGSDSTTAVGNESSDMGSHDKRDQQGDQSQHKPTQQGEEQNKKRGVDNEEPQRRRAPIRL